MKIETADKKTFEIEWTHYNDTRSTYVVIEFVGGGWYTGMVKCHPNDKYTKVGGRKAAVAKAIKDLPRVERGAIWHALWNAGVRYA